MNKGPYLPPASAVEVIVKKINKFKFYPIIKQDLFLSVIQSAK